MDFDIWTADGDLIVLVYIKEKNIVCVDKHFVLYRYTIVNKNGMVLQVIDLGGIITTIKVPDKNAKFDDVTLGFDDLKGMFYVIQSLFW